MMRFQYLSKFLKCFKRWGTQGNDSIYIPIDFELRNTENNELVWQYDVGSHTSQDTNLFKTQIIEIFVPALSAGTMSLNGLFLI